MEAEDALSSTKKKLLYRTEPDSQILFPVCSNPWQQWCKRAATGIAASAQTSCKFSKSQNLGCNVYLTCFWDWNTDAHLRACFIALQKICSNRLQRNSRILTCLFGAILAKPTLFWVAQSSFLWKWPTTPQANLQTEFLRLATCPNWKHLGSRQWNKPFLSARKPVQEATAVRCKLDNCSSVLLHGPTSHIPTKVLRYFVMQLLALNKGAKNALLSAQKAGFNMRKDGFYRSGFWKHGKLEGKNEEFTCLMTRSSTRATRVGPQSAQSSHLLTYLRGSLAGCKE